VSKLKLEALVRAVLFLGRKRQEEGEKVSRAEEKNKQIKRGNRNRRTGCFIIREECS
jgi:hypothetical protein